MIYLKRLCNLILLVICLLIAIILSPTIIFEMTFVVVIYYIVYGELYMDKHSPFCMYAPMYLWNKLKFDL